jgi:hypothetical protein
MAAAAKSKHLSNHPIIRVGLSTMPPLPPLVHRGIRPSKRWFGPKPLSGWSLSLRRE